MKTKSLYIATLLLIALFPFGNAFVQILRGLSMASLHFFEKRASFTLTIPPLFHKYIHLYLTDLWILGLLIFALWTKQTKWKELFLNRHSQFLTFYAAFALLSIACSLFASYIFLYVMVINLLLSFAAFHLIYLFFSAKEDWISYALFAFIGGAGVECLIGIGQFLIQHDLGLTFLSEPRLSPDMHNIATYPVTDANWRLFQLFPWIEGNQGSILRAYGTFDHPNIFGGYLVAALFSSYALLIQAKNRLQKGALFLLLPLLILTLTLTFSRSAYFAWVIGSLLFFSLAILKKMKRIKTLILSVLSASMTLFLILLDQLVSRGGFVNYNSLATSSDLGRFQCFKIALLLFLKHPFLGIGYHGFALFPYERLDPALKNANPEGTLAHNLYLQIASETGLMGVGTLALFLFSMIYPALKAPLSPISLSLGVTLFSFLLIGVADHYLWAYQSGRLLFFIFAALLAAYTKAREWPSCSQSK